MADDEHDDPYCEKVVSRQYYCPDLECMCKCHDAGES